MNELEQLTVARGAGDNMNTEKYEQWIEALTSLPTCNHDCPFLLKYGHTGHDAIDARCDLFEQGLRWDKDHPGEFFKSEHCKALYLIF